MAHKKEIWLLDTNVVKDAIDKGDRTCGEIIFGGPFRGIRLKIIEDVMKEILTVVRGKIEFPDYIIIHERPTVSPVKINIRAIHANIQKEFGGVNGGRKEPSSADRALVNKCVVDNSLTGIISNDSDIYYLWAEENIEVRERFSVKKPNEIINRLRNRKCDK